VTWNEFRDYLSNRRISRSFKAIDADGDGVISSEEFAKFYAGDDMDHTHGDDELHTTQSHVVGKLKVDEDELAEFVRITTTPRA